ncbi:hypothetical protein BK133_05220 [Paenibacillus sp. FSL H8-0548]|uniref:replicative helicase loader/inhibitor n=1 Tax=Paenibacillus sp. FSL H8-0548 TaxID=1920422 RepID=UPI00096DD7AF|nr:replicative helicase loader/inhibitor [Paenibacillus sp. FSL H8-0548]OMF37458.1 hypothetical protein BK133_05220 [Paenibacillus sp. FSL H8-0548]
MNKAEISEIFKRIKRAYAMFHIPDEINSLRELVEEWSDFLADIPDETVKVNLRRYVLNPDNKYPPHPGALARPLDTRTDADRYHEHMQASGMMTLEQWELMRNKAVPPTEEQRRKVRELLGK